jgi:hypothetical protein
MVLRYFCLVLVFLLSLGIVCGANDQSANYLAYNGFSFYDNLSSNKVSYSIRVENQINYSFEMDYYYNGELLDTCDKSIFLDEGEVFKKVTCDVKKMGDGEYVFDAFLKSSQSNYSYFSYESIYLFNDTRAEMDFEVLDDKTNIVITIDGNYEDVVVKQEIPKSVIEILNSDNKDELIDSELDYYILKEDPLIAWNVDRVPSTVNYTINKQISEEDKKKFKLEVSQKRSFKMLKYAIFVLILVILVVAFKPVFLKKKKK